MATKSPLQSAADPEASTAVAVNDPQLWQTSQQLPGIRSFTSTPVNSGMEQLPPPQAISGLNGIDGGLPPADMLQELVELFYEMVYPWVPLFYKPNFTANMFSPERQLVLHGMVIISFRFWRKEEPSLEIRDDYIKASRDQILLKTVDNCDLISTQALTLLAVDALGQGQGPRTWNVMSMLVAAARHLCLYRILSSAHVETNAPLSQERGTRWRFRFVEHRGTREMPTVLGHLQH